MWDNTPELESLLWTRVRLVACTLCTGLAGVVCLAALTLVLGTIGTPFFVVAIVVAIGFFAYALALGSLALYLAPRYTLSLVAVTASMAMLLLPLPSALLHAREESRRTQCMNNLRLIFADELHGPREPWSDPVTWDAAGMPMRADLGPVPSSITLRSGQRYPAYEP